MPDSRSRRYQGKQKEDDDLDNNLKNLQTGIQQLRNEIASLNAINDDLLAELEISRATSGHGQTCSTDDDINLEDLQRKDLSRTVKQLRSENHRLLRRIEKLKHKQLQDEVEDLREQSHANGDDTDSAAYMRKTLREFSDLMLVSTLRADMTEVCPFCSKKLIIKKCSALPCGHMLCNICLPRMSKGADETVKCADCERVFPRDELELVHYTEQERWDQLLLRAQAWAAFDRRGEMETSEEEAEENFLTDDNGTSDFTSEEGNDKSLTIDTDDDVEAERPLTPALPEICLSFSESPTKLKRKKMEELAAEMRSKRKRTLSP